MSYPTGDFSFFPAESDRRQYADFYQAITKAEAWEGIKGEPGEGGFMFSRGWGEENIRKHMTTLDEHSGASYAIGMRRMQYIANNGWDAFVTLMLPTVAKAAAENAPHWFM
jgi:hypothetical protein